MTGGSFSGKKGTIRIQMIDQHTIYPLHYYTYQKAFTGSLDGKRYRILRCREAEEEADVLKVWIWPEPFSFEHTDPEQMTVFSFPFSEEGYEQLLRCLNEHLVSE